MARRLTRAGRVHSAWLGFLASVAVLAGLIGLLLWNPDQHSGALAKESLFVYCAAGIKAPVEAVAREYEKTYGVQVKLNYGGSQTLLANLKVNKYGDLYLPADDSYIQLARQQGLLHEDIPLARMTTVLAVARGNPKGIRSLDDLLKGGVRIAQANPDAAAVGKVTRAALQKTGHWDKLAERTLVLKPTVNDVANDLKVGAVDAGIVWDATVKQYPELEMVPVPELADGKALVAIGVLQSSTQPTAALHFARYLAAQDKGLVEFIKYGFHAVDGDAWAEQPELRLLAGAMLRPAIEETITAFEKREGVKVKRVYNGCGILVAQMRTGEHPDAYFACDKSFMTQVNDLFLDAVDVSTNQLVILVPKGNPRGIKSLKDLTKKDLRVGVGHEKQCAMGVLTQQTLRQGGFYQGVMKNVVVQLPTGDMLVNELRTGSLDAVIAYISNATSAADKLEAIKIEGIPCSVAVQPLAVGKESRHKYLAMRLLNAIRSRESQERFESSGFHWQGTARQ